MSTRPEVPPGAANARPASTPLRVATYNTSLFSDEAGGVVKRLRDGDPEARKVAAVLQRVRPDLVLLNEFDYAADNSVADAFQDGYLAKPQPLGGEPLRYPYRYLASVNTGVASGLDLDGNGKVGGKGRDYGNDAWGYGLHPGQYGMLVLSKYPIDTAAVRTFQNLRWSTMPGALKPVVPSTGKPYYADAVWQQLRLSSKSHWDVPVDTPQGTVHFLVAHPTPPTFDGPDNHNGLRNHDEIRLWAEYLSPGDKPWLCDDAGRCGGLAPAAQFVIAGDLNADPYDGDGESNAVAQLLEHPRVLHYPAPQSAGGPEQARAYGVPRKGPLVAHTGDFGARVGTLRLDYVLPSNGFRMLGNGIWWPEKSTPDAAIADGSDHHLVWVDIEKGPASP